MKRFKLDKFLLEIKPGNTALAVGPLRELEDGLTNEKLRRVCGRQHQLQLAERLNPVRERVSDTEIALETRFAEVVIEKFERASARGRLGEMTKEEIETSVDVAQRKILKRLEITESTESRFELVTVDTKPSVSNPMEGSTPEGEQVLTSGESTC